MSWFSVDFDVAPSIDVLRDLRQKVQAIRTPVFEAARGPIRDAVAQDVNQLIAPAPGPSQHPFIFATIKSAAWYFWAMRTHQIPGQDYDPENGSWQRTNTLESGWNVSVDVSANESFLTVSNDAADYKSDNYAQAVYGPDPGPGLANNGWGEDFDQAIERIADHVTDMLLDALDEAFAGFAS